MHLILVGLSHHDAPIEVRERLSCTEHRLPDALAAASACVGVHECVILSTCNRMEAYGLVEGPDVAVAYAVLSRYLSSFHNVPEAEIAPYLYRKSEQEVALHLFRVAAGLDSLVLGEAQILGQVRTALRIAQKAKTPGAVLSHLFMQALNSGKRVQQETGFGRGAFSIGHAAVDLASRIFTLSEATVLILGAGKMSELTAKHLVSNGVRFVVVANRTHEKAVAMAAKLGGQAIQYDAFPEALVKADIVIASTAAPHPIVGREMLRPLVRRRKGKPLFLIDIAVPRDIDPDVADLDNVFLYNIDHLQEAVLDRARGRTTEALQAEAIVAEELNGFLSWYRAREATPVITQLRARLDGYAQRRLAILQSRLGPISERDWALIETQLCSLMDEVAREPILRLKRASGEAAGVPAGEVARYDLLSAAREIFGLGPEECNEKGEETP